MHIVAADHPADDPHDPLWDPPLKRQPGELDTREIPSHVEPDEDE